MSAPHTRTSNFLKNSFTSIALQITSIIITFGTRKVFLYYLGLEYAGVGGLFTNVLSLLALTELGFNSAITYNLFSPLEKGDHARVASLMRFFRTIYGLVAVAVAVIGLLLSLDLGMFVGETTLEHKELLIIYYLYLFKSVTSYLFVYRTTLALADQKSFLFFKVDMITKYALAALNLLVIILTRNYILYLVGGIVVNITVNLIKSGIVKRHYPYLKGAEKLDKETRGKVLRDSRNILVGRVSTVILQSTDNVIISKMINIATVGLYGNYTQIVEAIINIMMSFGGAMQSTFGSLVASEDKEHAHDVFLRATSIFQMMAIFVSTSLLCLTSPLIALMYDRAYVLTLGILCAIIVNSYLQVVKTPLWTFLGVTGMFSKDKYISLTGAVSNLVLSIALVIKLGLLGVILGTILSQFIQLVLKTRLLYKEFFHRSARNYVGMLIKGVCAFACAATLTYLLCGGLRVWIPNAFWSFVVCMAVCCVLPNLVTILFYRGTPGFDYLRYLIRTYMLKLLPGRGKRANKTQG